MTLKSSNLGEKDKMIQKSHAKKGSQNLEMFTWKLSSSNKETNGENRFEKGVTINS